MATANDNDYKIFVVDGSTLGLHGHFVGFHIFSDVMYYKHLSCDPYSKTESCCVQKIDHVYECQKANTLELLVWDVKNVVKSVFVISG